MKLELKCFTESLLAYQLFLLQMMVGLRLDGLTDLYPFSLQTNDVINPICDTLYIVIFVFYFNVRIVACNMSMTTVVSEQNEKRTGLLITMKANVFIIVRFSEAEVPGLDISKNEQ